MAKASVRSNVLDDGAITAFQENPSNFTIGYIDKDPFPDNILGSLGLIMNGIKAI